MNFKKVYESKDTNWRDKVGSREEMNAYIDYKRARDKGASHQEAMAQVAEGAQADAKFKRLVRGKDLSQAGPSNT